MKATAKATKTANERASHSDSPSWYVARCRACGGQFPTPAGELPPMPHADYRKWTTAQAGSVECKAPGGWVIGGIESTNGDGERG